MRSVKDLARDIQVEIDTLIIAYEDTVVSYNAKIDLLQDKLDSYQNITENDVKGIAKYVTDDLVDFLVDGTDIPVKIKTQIIKSVTEWFTIAGETL